MLIIGIILIVVSGLLFYFRHRKQEKILEMRSMERRKAGDITEIANEIAAELGHGSYEATAELVGDIVADKPLTSPLGERPCVYFSMQVTRDWEEEYWDRDSNGNRVRKTRSGSDVVNSQKDGVLFELQDESGRLPIDPTSARFDGLKESVSRFEPATQVGGQLRYGRWSHNLPGMPMQQGRQTLGYRYREHILEPGTRITAMGKITDTMGQLAMRETDDQELTLSTRSRAELVKAARKTAKLQLIFGIICALGGVALTIVGAVQ